MSKILLLIAGLLFISCSPPNNIKSKLVGVAQTQSIKSITVSLSLPEEFKNLEEYFLEGVDKVKGDLTVFNYKAPVIAFDNSDVFKIATENGSQYLMQVAFTRIAHVSNSVQSITHEFSLISLLDGAIIFEGDGIVYSSNSINTRQKARVVATDIFKSLSEKGLIAKEVLK